MGNKGYWAHPSCEIQEGASVGNGTKIWHGSQVFAGAVIGEDCTIGHNCLVSSRAKLGKGVKLESNIDVWDLVSLEDYVFVGPSAVFTNDPNPRAKYPKSQYPEYGAWKPTLVRQGATIGANATIVCGVTVGEYAMVGAGAVVTKDVPSHALVLGVPARVSGWVCECGNTIDFEKEKAQCAVCKKTYIQKDNEVCRSAETV
jgi:UDP-2-acetamido-3-amino-2,3-dideoxy-glucuronate N-acetyltransferase